MKKLNVLLVGDDRELIAFAANLLSPHNFQESRTNKNVHVVNIDNPRGEAPPKGCAYQIFLKSSSFVSLSAAFLAKENIICLVPRDNKELITLQKRVGQHQAILTIWVNDLYQKREAILKEIDSKSSEDRPSGNYYTDQCFAERDRLCSQLCAMADKLNLTPSSPAIVAGTSKASESNSTASPPVAATGLRATITRTTNKLADGPIFTVKDDALDNSL